MNFKSMELNTVAQLTKHGGSDQLRWVRVPPAWSIETMWGRMEGRPELTNDPGSKVGNLNNDPGFYSILIHISSNRPTHLRTYRSLLLQFLRDLLELRRTTSKEDQLCTSTRSPSVWPPGPRSEKEIQFNRVAQKNLVAQKNNGVEWRSNGPKQSRFLFSLYHHHQLAPFSNLPIINSECVIRATTHPPPDELQRVSFHSPKSYNWIYFSTCPGWIPEPEEVVNHKSISFTFFHSSNRNWSLINSPFKLNLWWWKRPHINISWTTTR